MGTRDRRSRERVILYRAEIPGEEEVHEVEYESLADALHFACRDLRSGRRLPVEITEDGRVVYDRDRLQTECAQEQREMDERIAGASEQDSAPHPDPAGGGAA